MDATTRLAQEKYPSVELAYEFVFDSYKQAQDRCMSIDGSIMMMLSLAVSATLMFPIAASALELELHRGWLVGALAVFVIIMLIGIWGRFFRTGFAVAHPGKMYKNDLHLSHWEFKKNAVYRAGNNLNKNTKLAVEKMVIARAIALLLILEVLFLLFSLEGIYA